MLVKYETSLVATKIDCGSLRRVIESDGEASL